MLNAGADVFVSGSWPENSSSSNIGFSVVVLGFFDVVVVIALNTFNARGVVVV